MQNKKYFILTLLLSSCYTCEKVKLAINSSNETPKFVAIGPNSVHLLTNNEQQKLVEIFQHGACTYGSKTNWVRPQSGITTSETFYFISFGKDLDDIILFDSSYNLRPGKYVFKEEIQLEKLCELIAHRTQKDKLQNTVN